MYWCTSTAVEAIAKVETQNTLPLGWRPVAFPSMLAAEK